jgi:hypothetical protein
MFFSLLTSLFQRKGRAGAPPEQGHRLRSPQEGVIDAPIPTLDNFGLMSIERRIDNGAPVADVQRWMAELEAQLPLMEPAVQLYARDLLVKLRSVLVCERLPRVRGLRAR